MEEAKLASLLSNVRKSNDKGAIYRNLVAIRANFVTSDGGIKLFTAQDGINVLVELLSKPYEKVIEVVLSILGNCCTKKECCKQAFECGILKPLISIISNIPNPSIQCRGCRLLGNLAQHEPISYKIARDNGNTAYALSTILNESDNKAVLIMVIRAIRQLWREKSLRTTLMEQGCIGKIAYLLVRYAQIDSETESPPAPDIKLSPTGSSSGGSSSSFNHDEEKVVLKHWHAPDRMVTKEKFNNIVRNMEHSQLCDIVGYQVIQNYRWKDRPDFRLPESDETGKLFESALKCLQMITTTVVQQVIEEIYGEAGAGLHCLVYLCGETSPFRALSLKVVSNLAANPDAIDRLTECGVIKMAADLIMYANLDESEKRYCINMMCLLTKEACNRGHIRRSGALQSFMKIAKQSHEKREQAMILYALYQYRFDSLSNEILLSNGLVSFLVRILNGIIADREVAHIRHDEEESERVSHASVFSKRRATFAKAGKMRRSDLLFHYKSGNGYHQKQQQQQQQQLLLLQQPHHTAAKQSKLDPYCSAPESPDSGSSGYASTSYGTVRSPSTSVGSSPPRLPEDEAFEDDTEVYSPVCSDHEQEDESSGGSGEPTGEQMAASEAREQNEQAEEEEEADPVVDGAEEMNDFDMVAYLIEDSSNAKWLDAAEELEDDSTGLRATKTTTSHHAEDCIDDNEMFKIELEIATAKTFERYPMQPTLTLLWSVSKSFPAMEFVQADTLETLLKICKHAKKPRGRAFQTLANILKHVNHFLPLLKQDFVFRLHEMKTPYPAHGARCWSCDEMRTACNDLMALFGSVGETGYGQGEIAHILRTGERDLKLRVAIIVLFVVRDTRLLHKLLFDMKVLEMVMDFILDEGTNGQQQQQQQQHRLNGIACSAITRLAQNLSIVGEEEDTGTPSEKLEEKEFDNTVTICDESATSVDEKVTFRVRSSPTAPPEAVLVSKALLVEGSEVFRRMFEADHFIESKNNEVHLHEPISADGLRYFFYLVRLQTLNKLTGMAPPPKVIEASLDALSLAQKYLLPTVEKPVMNIIKTLLNDDCVLNVFEWSLKNYNQELLVASTYYFLYSDISGAAKCKLYRAANRSCYRDEWRRLLTETILYRVQPNAEL
ncbi:AGAP001615-PA [Anopheles gambiae str. PEST]|uniref:AGAP001615-PA n=1 Tax=Anopheles gambiae TaxID=7165 RepID=Q7PUT6_ANOGA|nr:AGAP001615-PA [Anopheles gambiae str. PEST]